MMYMEDCVNKCLVLQVSSTSGKAMSKKMWSKVKTSSKKLKLIKKMRKNCDLLQNTVPERTHSLCSKHGKNGCKNVTEVMMKINPFGSFLVIMFLLSFHLLPSSLHYTFFILLFLCKCISSLSPYFSHLILPLYQRMALYLVHLYSILLYNHSFLLDITPPPLLPLLSFIVDNLSFPLFYNHPLHHSLIH